MRPCLLVLFSLDVLHTVNLQINNKYNWQCAGTEPAIFTASVEEHWVGLKGMLLALCVVGKNNWGEPEQAPH